MIKVSRLVLAALFLLLFSGMSFGQEMGAGESGPETGVIGGSSASMIVDPSIFGSSSSTGYSSSSTGGTDWSKCTETVFIGTAGALKEFASSVNNGNTSLCGRLTDDIDLNGGKDNRWTPIGIELKPFVGTFDGRGHTISGLYVDVEMNYVGLFGYVGKNGVVTNVGVVNSYIKGIVYVGGVVGKSEGNVSNVYNTGAVNGDWWVGGIVGYNTGSVSNVYNTGAVNGDWWVGGVVGKSEGNVSNMYNTGTVSGTGDYIGGVVGENNDGSVSNVYNTGAVSGAGYYVDGVAGLNNDGTVSNAYYNKDFYSGDAIVKNVGESTNVSEIKTADLANGTLPDGFSATDWGAGSHAENSLAYYLPYLVAFEDGARPFVVNQPVVTVVNDDAYFKSDAVTADDFSVTLSFDSEWFVKDNSKFDFAKTDWAKSTWDSDGVVRGTYDGVDFTVTAPAVVISSDKKQAAAFGSSKQTLDIPDEITVTENVTLKRSFAVGYSTMMLPFSVSEENLPDGLEFYSFDEVEEIDGKYTAKYTAASVVEANKPYIVKNSGESALSQVTFNGEFTLKTDFPASSSSSNGWEFKGTYEYKTWEEGDEGLGKTYGFAGSAGNDPKIVGQFAKVGAGAYIYPMRAYLEYDAPTKLGRPAANGVAAKVVGNANTVASLPETINVVIVDKGNVDTEVAGSDDASGEQTTRVIGTINTRTGEFKAAADRYFDMKGRFLGNKKPTQKGAYYNNGKKVIVK